MPELRRTARSPRAAADAGL